MPYTLQQIEAQLRLSDRVDMNGNVIESGKPDVINLATTKPIDSGAEWSGVPGTTFGKELQAQPDADLIGYIQSQQKDLQNDIPFTGTADFSRFPRTTNTPSPIPTANCGAGAADCAAGIAPPLTQAQREARRNQGADLAGSISTQAGRFAAAATAYGAYLASQPNVATQTGAAVQFGMAGTATVVGFGASAFEQFLRPDAVGLATGSFLEPIQNLFANEAEIMYFV
ncbi:hypothetical protein ACVBEF_12170 [Glaciimonas sp. GG7]